jgi:hypothetical protein
VAQGGADLAALVELDELGVQVGSRIEREHRAVATCDDGGVETFEVDLVDGTGGLEEPDELGSCV